ncbi:MAG: SDR family oxidoreductase [Burkholderiaceae bacterium]|nr:SDR family oxidoreductase [Burkholderiaceae bacterium]
MRSLLMFVDVVGAVILCPRRDDRAAKRTLLVRAAAFVRRVTATREARAATMPADAGFPPPPQRVRDRAAQGRALRGAFRRGQSALRSLHALRLRRLHRARARQALRQPQGGRAREPFRDEVRAAAHARGLRSVQPDALPRGARDGARTRAGTARQGLGCVAGVKAVHSADIRADYHDAIPLNRYGTEEEIAAAIWYLCSSEASYVNGQTLAVDGGFDAIGIGLPSLRGSGR